MLYYFYDKCVGVEKNLDMDINQYMTPRLLAVAEFVKKGSRVADIGTDHAYIPIWLLKNGISLSALAMDINEGPILRAEENIKKFSCTDTIKTRLSDGMKNLMPGEADTVIIAGMGGILINQILMQAEHLFPFVRHYILQPMTAIEETRKYLEKNGFCIEGERLAQEGNKLYNVISAKRGSMHIKDEIYYYIGEALIAAQDPLLPLYLDGKMYELDKAILSMQKAEGEETEKKLKHFESLYSQMKTIRENCASW